MINMCFVELKLLLAKVDQLRPVEHVSISITTNTTASHVNASGCLLLIFITLYRERYCFSSSPVCLSITLWYHITIAHNFRLSTI